MWPIASRYYEVDDSETVHYLSLLDYFTRADAPAWAWYVTCRRREHPIVCERSILLVWADDSAGNLICAPMYCSCLRCRGRKKRTRRATCAFKLRNSARKLDVSPSGAYGRI